jgi:DNA-binding response OmpR family regulator
MSTPASTRSRHETAMASILVIEDQPDLAGGLRANLEVEGYEVAVAHTGAEGLRKASAVRPALVILDLLTSRATTCSRACAATGWTCRC